MNGDTPPFRFDAQILPCTSQQVCAYRNSTQGSRQAPSWSKGAWAPPCCSSNPVESVGGLWQHTMRHLWHVQALCTILIGPFHLEMRGSAPNTRPEAGPMFGLPRDDGILSALRHVVVGMAVVVNSSVTGCSRWAGVGGAKRVIPK